MIEIKNFSKCYGKNTVFSNFNLTLEEGRITCLLGSSGSGKTTLLNAIAGLIKGDGCIPKLKCSYIFQSPQLIPNFTVRGNLALISDNGDKINKMLERVGLSERADSYPINLSGGEAKRVAIARAFLYKSDILLMDEPFSSLDLKLKKQITELFFEMWEEDKRTVLMVTHDIDEATAVAERILVLSHGNIITDYTPETSIPRPLCKGSELREKLIGFMLNC